MTDQHSPHDELEYELALLWRRARAKSHELARQVHPDIESESYGLMVRLLDGAARASDLAASFGVGKSTISRQITLLEDLGMVERTPDPADGRASLVDLTSEGRTLVTAARAARQKAFRQALSNWSQADIAQLARLLHRLNQID